MFLQIYTFCVLVCFGIGLIALVISGCYLYNTYQNTAKRFIYETPMWYIARIMWDETPKLPYFLFILGLTAVLYFGMILIVH